MKVEIEIPLKPKLKFLAEVQDEAEVWRLLALLNRRTEFPVFHTIVPEHTEA